MGIPGSANLLLGGVVGGYEIGNSLRWHNDSNQYLSQSVNSAPTTSTAATLSFWMKVSKPKNEGYGLFDCRNGSVDWGMSIVPYNSGFGWGDMTFGSAENATGVVNYWTLNQTSTQCAFRDPSAWYHVVVVWEGNNGTSTRRMQTYVNNKESYFYNYYGSIGSGASCPWTRNGYTFKIGHGSNSEFILSEFHCVDGQALAPSNFAEYDSATGAWTPIPYGGTYGNNGFYLQFDPSATNGVGHDSSGQGNHFSATGFSTSTATYNKDNDSLLDSPTNNCAIWLPGKSDNFVPGQAQAYADYRNDANMYGWTGRNSPNSLFSSIPFPDNAKTYMEVYINDVGGGGGSLSPGLAIGCDYNGYGPWTYGSGNYNQDTAAYFSGYDGAFSWNGGSGTSNGGGYGAGTLIGIAVDTTTSSPTIKFYKNGTLAGTGTVGSSYRKSLVVRVESSTGSSTAVGAYINSGQYAFYSQPSGYDALTSANIPDSAVKNSSEHFKALTYTGAGSSSAYNVTGLNFQPDFVWIKNRQNGSAYHRLFDVLRGPNYDLVSSLTDADNYQGARGYLQSFNSNGFTTKWGSTDGRDVGGLTNDFYVGWCWKAGGSGSSNTAGSTTSTVTANATAGFSIATWSSNGSTTTVGHGLGTAPAVVLVKDRSTNPGYSWYMWHHKLSSAAYFLRLNTTGNEAYSTDPFGGTAPTSTVFTVGGENAVNGHNYIAYCFAEVPGFSAMGKYIGNGSEDGPIVYTGFKPAFLLRKGIINAADDWTIIDTSREPYNQSYKALHPNQTLVEQPVGESTVDILSNGFKMRTGNYKTNSGGATYMYIAFAESPFKSSTAR